MPTLPRKRVPAAKVKAVTNAKRKRTKKLPGKKQGKPSWVHGTKLAFFESYRERWEAMGDTPGRFYTEMAKRFLLKYGWDSRFSLRDNDLEVDTEDATDEELAAFVSPEDEVEERTEYFFALRTVCYEMMCI